MNWSGRRLHRLVDPPAVVRQELLRRFAFERARAEREFVRTAGHFESGEPARFDQTDRRPREDDHIALEWIERRQDREHGLPHRAGGVQALGQATESHPIGFELFNYF